MTATVTLCRVCQEPIEREPGKRGRPPVAHPACREKPGSHKRISPAVSREPGAKTARGCTGFEAHSLNDRLCRDCLGWVWEH